MRSLLSAMSRLAILYHNYQFKVRTYAEYISMKPPISVKTMIDKANSIPVPPIIHGFSPGKGPVGTDVIIQGEYFVGATAVQFNGVDANIQEIDPYFLIGTDIIRTTVPANATDGPITVTNQAGSATSRGIFHVELPLPAAHLKFYDKKTDPTYPTVGQQFTVYFHFINDGGTPTGYFTIRLELFSYTLGKIVDVGYVSVPSYDSGKGYFVHWIFLNGLGVGNYLITAYTDTIDVTDNYFPFSISSI